MTFRSTVKFLSLAVFALSLVQKGFADPLNSCFNVGIPVEGIVSITCNLAYNGSPNTFDLSSLMTQSGSALSNNDYVSNYTVLINGNPSTLADDSTGLFNQSLWQAVLFFPGNDPDGIVFSDTLQVFWPGSFPSASTVQSYNTSIFGGFSGFKDSAFFVQSTGLTTSIGTGTPDVFNITVAPSATPEPSSLALMATGIMGLGLLGAMRRQRWSTSQSCFTL